MKKRPCMCEAVASCPPAAALREISTIKIFFLIVRYSLLVGGPSPFENVIGDACIRADHSHARAKGTLLLIGTRSGNVKCSTSL